MELKGKVNLSLHALLTDSSVAIELRHCRTGSCIPSFVVRGRENIYEGWNFNSGNYLFTTDTKQIYVSKFYCPSM